MGWFGFFKMNIETIKSIIANGESLTVEFKESKTQLNKDVYEILNKRAY